MEATGKFHCFDGMNVCRISIDNYNGSVSDVMYNATNYKSYVGRYYTVNVCCDDVLISTEYYTGNRSGIGSLSMANGITAYYEDLKLYTFKGEIPKVAKITEIYYSFTDDAVKSDGSVNSGAVQ